MPKKTKKEKLAATERKKQRFLMLDTKNFYPAEEKNSVKNQDNSKDLPVRDPGMPRVKKQFTSDLKRSLFFSLGIIALEIALYFVTIRR